MKENINRDLIGVIPAAGKGIRLYPWTKETSKSLLKIDGISIIERNIDIMRQLGINLVYILVGHKKEQIKESLKSGGNYGLEIRYVEVSDIDKGLAYGLLQLEKYIKSIFCVILGDEVYYNSNHEELKQFLNKDFSVVCTIKEVKHPHIIRKNYAVEIKNNFIVSLKEKPKEVRNNLLGCGTYLFKPSIFNFIKSTPISEATKRIELTEAIDLTAKSSKVLPFYLKGIYVNVNNIDDYNNANYIIRSVNFDKKVKSLIIPAYNEESSIGYVIDDYRDKVDEVLVIDNNSNDKTKEIAEKKGAKVIRGKFKGYGDALKFGMDNSKGDILILTEADGSFFARDIGKFLEYLKDADMVLGTRTTKQMIEQAANMPRLLRWGNVFVAKLIEILWLYKSEPRLTDVGCTYRALWRSAYQEIRDSLESKGPEFSPEMIIEAMRYNKRIIEIPVTYSGRIGGESKFSKSLFTSAKTALRMLKLIMSKKILDFINNEK
jgi:dTDP-glucose pyrophosphorylase